MKVVGAELAAARHAVVTEIAKAATTATAAERAAAEGIVAAAMTADRVPQAGEPLEAGMMAVAAAAGVAIERGVSHDRVLCVGKHI
ncbi:conserved hypothetical protein [Burkholderia vietnamiensis]